MENLYYTAQLWVVQFKEDCSHFSVRQDGLLVIGSLLNVPLEEDGHLIQLTTFVKVLRL